MKLNDIYKKYLKEFKKRNIEEISLRILLCDFFNISNMSDFYLNLEEDFKLNEGHILKINQVLQGNPVAYVLNKTIFYGLEFYVNEDVLIPRNETEELVNLAIKKINNKFNKDKKLFIADLGTGSGNIAICLDKNLDYKTNIDAVDISKKAINVCKINKEKHGSNINLICEDMFKYLKKLTQNLNILVCNPPYISKINEIDESVFKFEPHQALIANPSYYFYEKIINNYKNYMDKDFIIIFEIGYDQKEILEGICFNNLDLNKVKYEFIKDINKNDRILIIESL